MFDARPRRVAHPVVLVGASGMWRPLMALPDGSEIQIFWPTPDEHVKQTTDRMMAAIVSCVARARELYPNAAADHEQWWWRGPDTAGAHRRTA